VPDAIIFDLDDTIIITQIPTNAIWNAAVSRYTAELNGLEPQAVFNAIRAAADWYWSDLARHRDGRLNLRRSRREVVKLAFERLGRTDFTLSEKIADTYSDERDSDGLMAPGTADILNNLRQRGLKLGMITNGGAEMQRAKIVKFGLAPYFDNILVEGEFGCGKPEERVFRYTLEKLKVKPEKTWMVGDDLRYDIAPCKALGIYSLWVDKNGGAGLALDGVLPDKTIRAVAEIPELL